MKTPKETHALTPTRAQINATVKAAKAVDTSIPASPALMAFIEDCRGMAERSRVAKAEAKEVKLNG